MTVIGALSSFRELGEMSPHKRASSERSIGGEKPTTQELTVLCAISNTRAGKLFESSNHPVF